MRSRSQLWAQLLLIGEDQWIDSCRIRDRKKQVKLAYLQRQWCKNSLGSISVVAPQIEVAPVRIVVTRNDLYDSRHHGIFSESSQDLERSNQGSSSRKLPFP